MITPADIAITTKCFYIVEQTKSRNQFLWAYEIKITNNGSSPIQLLNRSWLITDMIGRLEQIEGIGVIGLQPVIKPGKEFSYSSFCQLTTPQGVMEGRYEMQDIESEARFYAEIPKIILSCPSAQTSEYRALLH